MRLFAAAIVLAFFSSISMGVQTSLSQGLDLVLPTDNDGLFSGDGAAFYQYVERNYKGVKSTPWEGGQYGFVRDPTDTAGENRTEKRIVGNSDDHLDASRRGHHCR